MGGRHWTEPISLMRLYFYARRVFMGLPEIISFTATGVSQTLVMNVA